MAGMAGKGPKGPFLAIPGAISDPFRQTFQIVDSLRVGPPDLAESVRNDPE